MPNVASNAAPLTMAGRRKSPSASPITTGVWSFISVAAREVTSSCTRPNTAIAVCD